MNNALKLQYYKIELLSLKRKITRKQANNAKPILLLALFFVIEQKIVVDNRFYFESDIENIYNHLSLHYCNDTPYIYPFYYMRNDGFLNFVYKNSNVILPRTPSQRFLRENLLYASFDNALWDLLQDVQCRNTLREAVIDHFLTIKN